MKLRTAPYPDPTGSGGYFFTQAGHRQTAIEMAIDTIRKAFEREIKEAPDDQANREFLIVGRDWVIKSLLQGAYLREYHAWETDTKQYFDCQHRRNESKGVVWKTGNHVSQVKQQLSIFSASVPDHVMAAIDQARRHVNTIKHKGTFLATEDDYKASVAGIEDFWSGLAEQESFTPPRPRSTARHPTGS